MHIGPGGSGLAAAAETAVRALAQASGIRLAAPARARRRGSAGRARAAQRYRGHRRTESGRAARGASAPSGRPVPLHRGIATAGPAALAAAGCLLASPGRSAAAAAAEAAARSGVGRERRRLAVPGTWLAGGFVGVAALLIVVHAVVQPSGSAAQGSVGRRPAR